MLPIFSFWGIFIPAWHLFFFLGAVGGYVWAHCYLSNRAPKQELRALPGIFSFCYFCGLMGARGLSIFVDQFNLKGFQEHFYALFSIGPMTFYGGAITCYLGGLLYIRVMKLNYCLFFNALVMAGVIALGIGRIGCFLNGDDFGKPVPEGFKSSWWAVTFPNLQDNIPRYPVQLMEAAWCFAIIFIVMGINQLLQTKDLMNSSNKKFAHSTLTVYGSQWLKKREGTDILGIAVMMLSALGRGVFELFRGDPRGLFWGTELSTSQGIAAIIFVLCLIRLVIIFLNSFSKQT